MRDAERGAVAQSELLRYVVVVRHGQDAAGGAYALAHDYHGAVVQRRVLEENVLYESLIDAGVYHVAGVDDVVEAYAALNDDERSHLAAREVDARHDDGHDGLLVHYLLLACAYKQIGEGAEALVGAERVEEAAYLFLKEHDDADDAHRHELVEDGSEQAHLEHLTHEEPHEHEHDDADEDVERTALLHQTIDVVEHQGDKKYVDDVFYSEVEHVVSFEF